ncbi:hypothetical protein [Arcticibacter eurypsychrophilus]|uniref:hypothetical protein n=1 Tax=Arcticibacter eurypsychrophilus TaxID=1434752 RepID=UPI00084D17EA|nr:hypothetical protein [Arcticibacter eurypsychrophilus]
MKHKFWLIYFICLIFISCKKDNTLTTLSGTMVEAYSSLPISDGKVYVWEYRQTNDLFKSHMIRHKLVDSVTTDKSGNYSLSFKSSVSAGAYIANFKLSSNYYYQYVPEKNLIIGSNNVMNVTAYQASFLKARVIYSENPKPPLGVFTQSDFIPYWTLSSHLLDKVRADTTLILKLIPNRPNTIYFRYTDGVNVFSYKEKITPENLTDTLVRTFNVNPTEFVR